MRIALASFTPGGAALARRVTAALGNAGGPGERAFTAFDKNAEPLRSWVSREFATADALVFVGATGIAVRMLDGLLRGKDKDPAVLVLDEKGEFVIPLLSGHIGGANRLAGELAASLGARAVITTATDINGVFAVDEWAVAHGCVIDDIEQIRNVSGALLRDERVGFHSDFPVSGNLPRGLDMEVGQDIGICVSLDAGKKPFAITLNVVPRSITLGAGCRKDTDTDRFERFVLGVLAEHGISVNALKSLASIDIKKNEPCLAAFAHKYRLTFEVFPAGELAAVPGVFTASAFVREQTGVDNVCERAAMAAGGDRLLVRKTARDGMTLALGAMDWTCAFE